VTVAWHIEPGGNVSGANVAGSSLGNPRVEGCVARQVKGWRFPSSEKPSDVTWPFKFGVQGG
jgi:outer membrane biosynthesis protein TonB